MNAVQEPGRRAISGDFEFGARGAVGRRRGSLMGRLIAPSLVSALKRWETGRLTVHLPDGQVVRAGAAAAEPHAVLRVHHERFFREFALRGDVGAGESYVAGDWETNDLPRFIELVLRNQRAVAGETWLTTLLNAPDDVRHFLRRNTRRGSRRNIRRHYDLSNEFFALFLDQTMAYSSAVFENDGETLTSAQQRKFARIADRLGLGPNDHLLEIGCGWGGFALFAANRYGCRVTGITVSDAQLALATARVKAAGLSERIDLRLCDYRDVAGTYSKIVSIEMLEAVGREHWATFFRKCDEVLAPGGLAAIQVITMPDHRFDRYARHCDWIQKHIFPGGLLPSIGELCRAMQRGTTFTIRGLEDIGPHYAETLARWRAAFFARIPDVRALGFDDRFIRMWGFYLASCEAAFRVRALGNIQFVIGRTM